MPSLTQAQPPAWAISLGTSLNEMYINNEILKEVLELAAANLQEEGVAAKSSGDQAAMLQTNQATATKQDAFGSISNGSINLGIQGGGDLSTFGYYRGSINGTTESLKNPSAWESFIEEVESNPNPASKLSAPGVAPSANLDYLKKENGATKILDATTKDDIVLAHNDPDTWKGLKKSVSNKRSNLTNMLQKSEGSRDQVRQRLSSFASNGGLLGQGTSKAAEATTQTDGAAMQLIKAMADFLSETAKAAQQTIMGLKDQLNNLMISTGESLISKIAESNKV